MKMCLIHRNVLEHLSFTQKRACVPKHKYTETEQELNVQKKAL